MDGNSELEEGEACFHEDEDDNINPDTAFSYIDEKIKNVLGHFQKDFEGGVCAENLGAKFGGYGSFLPTYERSPPRLSHPKTPQKNNSISGSTNSFSTEGTSQNLIAPPNAPPTGRPGNIFCPSGNIAAKHDSRLTSAQVAEKSALKDESFNRAGIPCDQKSQKTLKVRIKMGPDESGGALMVSQETTSQSPTGILQVMTSNHVPGGVLISPLHESLLCLLSKENERPSSETKSIPLLRACQEHPSMPIDVSVLGDIKQLHEKKTKFLIRKSEELVESKHGNRMNVETGKALLIKKKHATKVAGGESFPNDLKDTAPSNSVNIAREATARVCDVSAEATQNAVRDRLISFDSAKEDSLESISGRSRLSGKKKKQDKRSSLDEKDWEQIVDNSNKNASLDLGDNVGSKCYQKSAPLKLEEDSKTKVGQIATFRVQNKISVPSKKEKTLFEGKKSKGSKNTGELAGSMKASLRPDVGVTLKDTTISSQGFSSGKDKILKLKLQKDINKVQDNHRDALETNSEQKSGRLEPRMRHFQNRPKEYGPLDFETEHNGYLDKLKVKVGGRMVDNHLPGVDAPDVVPYLNDKRLTSQTAAPAATAPVVIEENWVQCDRCHKWRLLPFDTRPEQLPEKWLCSMLNWLPGMNRCDISEDETTKALNALYQALSIQGKKNRGLKEVQKVGNSGLNQMSNSKKQQQQESLKSKSLCDMIEAPVESIVMKKSTFEEKERLIVGGETKKAKKKNKRESGPCAYEGSKKSKTEVEYATDKHHTSNLEHRRVGLNSSTSLPTQANGRSVQNCNGGSNSGDVKHDIKEKSVASMKKLVGQTQASSDGGSLDRRICDKRGSVKKRKLDDWQDSQNGNELCMKEESSESGFRNEKKLRFSKIEGKQSNRNDCGDTPNRRSMGHLIGGIDEVRCIDRNQKISKHKKKPSSQKELDGLDSSRRDSGIGQIPIAATSSSSKHTVERSRSEDRLNNECGGNALFSQKSKKVSTSQTKDNKRSSAADKMKCSEDEKNYSGRRNPSGQPSSDSRMGTQSNIKHDVFDVKSAAPCSKKGSNAPEQNVIQDFSGQTKVMQVEVGSGMPKSPLRSETESWQEKKGHQTVPEAEQGVVSDEVPVNGSSSVDASKALKQPGKASSKNACSPSSGFVFESNEIYFQAALKFLGVAALLETSNSESGSLGDMNQMQVYSTATKLCEMCAQEYEKCQEMAAAALAYKCVGVTNRPSFSRLLDFTQDKGEKDVLRPAFGNKKSRRSHTTYCIGVQVYKVRLICKFAIYNFVRLLLIDKSTRCSPSSFLGWQRGKILACSAKDSEFYV
ncbi:hypothetical protein V6N13_054502 [Hibiscus sabdariffa]